ncbi:M20 family metallopeptidase [Natronorubrum tibetense]|uniref:Probable succinyl-diaminopimelate desuccinylase n=1 Tax=Natronorubrum tibetense GA33 TaxID=1114856 RepID=L9VPG6_9EURY|nr:M20 family metallopeptidase [Natronorubrum tibetense]ELY38882.1 peptidase M20 [Natronorubrum tibetense GA33]
MSQSDDEGVTDATDQPSDRIDPEATIELLQKLVRIRSPFFEEAAMARAVYDWLADRDLEPEYHAVSEPEITGFDGNNVVARLEGTDPDAPTLLLNGHMDTVRIVDGWDEDPLSGRIEDGRLYGQGACDMKGGLVSLLVAFEALAELDGDLAGDIVLTAVVGEEGPFGLGTYQLLRDGITDDVDGAIVAEPGPAIARHGLENPALLLGARGGFRYEITVRGNAAHASHPEDGTNAVVDAARIATALDEMACDSHPALGSGSICPLEIRGGDDPLSVPDRCTLAVNRHIVPGESAEVVLEQALDVVDDLNLESSVEVELRETPYENLRFGPYVTDEDHPLVRMLSDQSERLTGVEPSIDYFSSIGDFNHLGHTAEIPTVIVGPDGDNVHSTGEYVETDDVVMVARLVADTAAAWLS